MARTKRRRARGTGSVYQKNRLWSVSWVEKGERRYSHGYPTKDLAEKVRANIALDLAAGRGGLKRPKDAKPLRELAIAWLERREGTHRSHKDDRRRWARHLEPEIGHLVPEAVDTGTIRKGLGTNVEHNATHGSDAPETARTEIAYFFSALDIVRRE